MKCIPRSVLTVALVLWATSGAWCQAPTTAPLTIQTSSLPKAFLHQPYTFQLLAQGGTTPLTWELTSGFLPQGLALGPDGVLHGSPAAKGNFSFTVAVRDNSQPVQQRKRELTLQIVVPLVVEWSRYPRITGQKLDCAIRIANQTAQDLDFTIVALAVAEDGRATAIGYQHFTLKGDTANLEIPFSETLPRGSYELNVDAVGEAPQINTIYRARLVSKERLQVQQGP
ncbi:MAG TPA: putative Ig domain-containing protein [Terriglobales bacterium]|nr:putative Ig domain-containing protein [Terriglobales bacterium]